MFKILSTELEKLTTPKAKEFLLLNTFKAQRPIDARWLASLAKNMREGLFTTGHIGIAILKNGNGRNEYLVNGQHQCNAISLVDGEVDVVVQKFFCETMDDVSLLYRQFDNNKGRSLQNLVKMEAHSLGIDWPVSIASLVVSAAALYEGRSREHKNAKVELLKKYLRPGEFVKDLLTSVFPGAWKKESVHLMRSPVVRAILMTWEKAPVEAETFWAQVRDGENLKRNMPAFKLREYLKESNVNHGFGIKGFGRRLVTRHEMTSRCITAWNAFRVGRTTGLKYFPNKQIPKAV